MKFTIVTPSYNSEKYISETIESVLSQKGDFEIEYIIMDGGSTDKTVEIIKKYEEKLKNDCWETKCKNISFRWFSEKDKGMYDAINKGFAKATGDIYAWINSDDIYLSGAFEAIHKSLEKYSEIKWIKGITSTSNKDSIIYDYGICYLYNQKWIRDGIYGRSAYFIQQDSTFWKKELWKKIGGINNGFKLAGDYYLWTKFAEHEKLYSLKVSVSSFRKRNEQLSSSIEDYQKEQEKISPYTKKEAVIKIFFKIAKRTPQSLNPILFIIYKLVFPKQDLNVLEIKRTNIRDFNSVIISKTSKFIERQNIKY